MSADSIPFLWADIPGHTAFLLIAVSYYLTNIFWLRLLAVTEDFESDELIDVTGAQRGLVELHTELLHPDCGDANHRR